VLRRGGHGVQERRLALGVVVEPHELAHEPAHHLAVFRRPQGRRELPYGVDEGRRGHHRRIQDHDRGREGAGAGRQLERDQAAHAVADDHRPGDPHLAAEPGHVVGEPRNGVLLLWLVAPAVPAQVDGERPETAAEVGQLRDEVGAVAQAPVDEHEGWVPAPRLRVAQGYPVAAESSHPLHLGPPPRHPAASPQAPRRLQPPL
jgi:hypothetical protein